MIDMFYEENGVKYYVGDKVSGVFAEWDNSKYGVVKFGLFDAYFPDGGHESADAYGFYVQTESHKSGYSIVQIDKLCKYLK